MFERLKVFLAASLAGFVFVADASADVRLKDIVNIEGVRGNDLVGYGLVVGLDETSPYYSALDVRPLVDVVQRKSLRANEGG